MTRTLHPDDTQVLAKPVTVELRDGVEVYDARYADGALQWKQFGSRYDNFWI